MDTLVTVFVFVGLAIICAWTTYFYFKGKTLDDIREDVYRLFLIAEHHFTEEKSGKEKMEWVIDMTLEMLPAWSRIFVTEKTLEKVIQLWFDAVKDLLDDGKINKSSEE